MKEGKFDLEGLISLTSKECEIPSWEETKVVRMTALENVPKEILAKQLVKYRRNLRYRDWSSGDQEHLEHWIQEYEELLKARMNAIPIPRQKVL